nr:MAG TPA: hypothetical protein [Caudoviricetes sp.]
MLQFDFRNSLGFRELSRFLFLQLSKKRLP